MPATKQLAACVWDSGASGSGVALAQTVAIGKGVPLTLKLTVLDLAGAVVDISAATITLSVRSSFDGSLLLTRAASIVSGPAGTAQVVLTSGDTNTAEPRRYVFDLWMSMSGDQQLICPRSSFLLLKDVYYGAGGATMASGKYTQSFTSADLTTVSGQTVLDVLHRLGLSAPPVIVTDNNGLYQSPGIEALPGDVSNGTRIDFTGYTITGTWLVSIG